jgi:predicted transcriptional regulator
MTGERTVKRLRLSKALTIPESTTILEACRRMAVRRVDAVLLTDSNALLCGILTDKVCFFFSWYIRLPECITVWYGNSTLI